MQDRRARWAPRLRQAAASVAIGAVVFACLLGVSWFWLYLYSMLRYASAFTGVRW